MSEPYIGVHRRTVDRAHDLRRSWLYLYVAKHSRSDFT